MLQRRIVRAFCVGLLPIIIAANVSVIGTTYQLVSKTTILATFQAAVLLGLFGYLSTTPESRPRPDWCSLGRADLIGIGAFPFICAFGWLPIVNSFASGWGLLATLLFVSSIHILYAYELVMRLPPRIRNFRVQCMAGKMTADGLRRERELRWHQTNCKYQHDPAKITRQTREKAARYLASVRRSAEVRKQLRQSNTLTSKLFRVAYAILLEYEDTPAWIAAFMASASLFPVFVEILPVGPIAAALLLLPFALVPAAGSVKRRWLHCPSSSKIDLQIDASLKFEQADATYDGHFLRLCVPVDEHLLPKQITVSTADRVEALQVLRIEPSTV